MARTFGVIEGSSYAGVLAATDRATKAADVQVVRYEKVGEHDIAVVLKGDTEDIRVALQVAAGGDGGLTTAILTNTRYQLRRAFALPWWF